MFVLIRRLLRGHGRPKLPRDKLIPLSVHLLTDRHCSHYALLFDLQENVAVKVVSYERNAVECKVPVTISASSYGMILE